MGLNTWAAFYGAMRMRGSPGDVAMLAEEVTPVLKALRGNVLNVVARHQHMTSTQPTIYCLHHWGTGPAEKLANGFKAALNELGNGKSTSAKSLRAPSGPASKYPPHRRLLVRTCPRVSSPRVYGMTQ